MRFPGAAIIALGYRGGDTTRYYRNGVLNADGLVTWNAADASTGITSASDITINALVSNGRPVMWRADDVSAGRLTVGSALNGPVWLDSPSAPALAPTTNGVFSAGALLPTGGADPSDILVVRATSASIYAAGSHRLVSVKYDDSLGGFDASWYNVSTLGGLLTEDATT